MLLTEGLGHCRTYRQVAAGSSPLQGSFVCDLQGRVVIDSLLNTNESFVWRAVCSGGTDIKLGGAHVKVNRRSEEPSIGRLR